MSEVETPSLYEIAEMAEDAGLVEERETALVVFISCIEGGFVWMRGPSRAGKDEVVDAVEYCLPDYGDNFGVFKVPSSTSRVALFKKARQMNNKKIHRYPDISSLDEHLEQILKKHGEGQPITHELATGTEEGETKKQTIDPPDGFILFHASDNEKVDPDEYPELRNRALMVSVDASEELTKKINRRQARIEAGLIEKNVTGKREKEVRGYVEGIPKTLFIDGAGDILNPVAPALDNQNPLPQKFVEARQDFQRLLRFMRSITLFHHKDRMKTVTGGDARLYVTPKDVWLAMRIFGQDMVLSALNLRDRDMTMIRMLREDMSRGWTKSGLHQELREVGLNVTERDVEKSLNGMINKGYVRKDQSQSPVIWSATPFAKHATMDVQMDWDEIVEDTKATAREALDDDVAEEYIERFCEGDGLIVRNPFDGRSVDITETSDLEDMVESRMEIEEEVLEGATEGGDEEEEPEQDLGGIIQ